RKNPPSATRALAARKTSAFVPYTMRSRDHQDSLDLTVAAVRFQASASRSGRSQKSPRTVLYAMVGKELRRLLRFLKPAVVAREYARRFGIESSYRQLNEGRARTSSRSALLRLLLLGLALLLRNLWVLCCWIISAHRGPGARAKTGADFTLGQLLRWI